MKVAWLFLGVLIPVMSVAQGKLDTYIQLAFDNNQLIRQQQFVLQRNLAALEEAKRLYLPTINLEASYTRAGGGRTIDLPLGDLLNPVYGALNQMTQSDAFPKLENQKILLNPNNFYNAHLRTTYPLVNAEIKYNERIKRQQADLQRIEMTIFKRELAKDVKLGYYRYLQATEAVRIFENALTLVEESQRVNTVLFNNQKVNRTSVLRSTNEVTKLRAQLGVAEQSQRSAQAYLNFLLNRPTYAALEVDPLADVPLLPASSDTTPDLNTQPREELAKLRQAQTINRSLVDLAAAYRKPKVNLFMDIGSQGFKFAVNRYSPYYLGGVSLDLSVFSGGRNRLRVKQVELDGQALDAGTRYAEEQIQLQATTALNALASALTQYRAAQSQVGTSEQNYRDLQRLYREGQVLYLELLDAQNQVIADRLQVNISRFDAWSKQAELERATASLALN